ncbi:MAG: hypothetical protein GF308_21240 [Candidatus Heimdallarchaeota archaeon]|nr:hypothetical protein [Candidatus Heimdallarchaeota archaeon]
MPLDCWKINGQVQSAENMQEIISYCIDLNERRKEERLQLRRRYAEERQIEIEEYREEEKTMIDGVVIDQSIIQKIKRIIKKEGESIEKLSSQTNIPVKTLEKVLFQRLGLVVHDGKIYSWEAWEKEVEKELEKKNQ